MKITPFTPADSEEVLAIWNRTARGRMLFHPLTMEKLRVLFLEKPGFDPDGFLLARDTRGIAGGILVSAGTGQNATLAGLFDRNGHPGEGAQVALDAALRYLEAHGMTSLRTNGLSAVDSRDLPMLEFLWHNRFHNPSVYDGVIEQQIADSLLHVERELETFAVPSEIVELEASLRERGYVCRFVNGDEALISAMGKAEMPFRDLFIQALHSASPLEELMLAFSPTGEPVGGALVSRPGAPTDWPHYGCDCALFGPIGVTREHRGGIGKVLLFRTLERCRDWGFDEVIIQIAASILPFYHLAGVKLRGVMLTMQRPLGAQKLNIR